MTRPTNPAVSRLVDKQMRHWELARRQRFEGPSRSRREVEDFICISRMVGIADEVAAGVGNRLGWPVFDKQLLDAMAGDDRLQRQIYDSMDQRDLGWWEEALNPLLRGSRAVRNDYFHRLCSTLLSLACQGSAVFVGRGADRVLPAAHGLRVRLIAPLRQRTRSYAQAAGCSLDEAQSEIARIESEREGFLRRYFQVDAADPLRHDLVINLERSSPEQGVELVLAAHRIRGVG